MLPSLAMRTSALLPQSWYLFNAVDTGGGASSGTDTGASGGQGSAASGAPSVGAGSAAAHPVFTNDTMFVPPGSQTPVKWGDYQKQYISTNDHQTRTNNAVRAALQAVANLRKPNAQPQNTRTQAQPNAQPQDAFAGVRNLPIIDGQTLAQLGERIQREGLAPLYEWAGTMNQYLTGLDKRVKGAEQGVGAYTEAQSRQEFEGKLGNVLSTVAKEVLPGIDVSQHPVLNEFAQDVWLSYNPNDPNLEREFPGILKSRLEGFMALAQSLTKAKVEAARAQHRSFLTRGGNGQPANAGGAPRLSNRQIARNLFAADASRT